MKFDELDLLEIGHGIQLSGGIYSGGGKHLLAFFPGEDEANYDIECLDMNPDEWKQLLRQSDILETEVLQQAADAKITKAIMRKSARQIDTRVSWKVFHRDDYRCRYCNKGEGTPLTVDHLVLWEEGGPSIEENLITSCKKCNRKRGNMQYSDWLESSVYKNVSDNLPYNIQMDNKRIVETLDSIPKMVHKKSR